MDDIRTAVDLLDAASWTLSRSAPGAHADPVTLPDALDGVTAAVPGTVAQALLQQDPDGAARLPDLDAFDWWYCTRVVVPEALRSLPALLVFEGLATLAEVWIDGEHRLCSDNMFRRHVVALDALGEELSLCIVLRALTPRLDERRPRPRWRTALVGAQNLRWYRTALLGRIPAWTAPLPAVGPWRPVRALPVSPVAARECTVHAQMDGATGQVRVRAAVEVAAGQTLDAAWLEIDGTRLDLQLTRGESAGSGSIVAGVARIDAPRPWWPHTHGEPALYAWRLFARSGERVCLLDAGQLGFRSIQLDRAAGGVRFVCNGEPVFCRGACWTTADLIGHNASPDALRARLRAARDAGMNMIRVGGTMVYESDAFYALCDELGLLVWQDFMFANMDYPLDDTAFAASAVAEAREQLDRLARHASVAVYCGNSEVEQQAAMRGVAAEHWRHAFFAETLPALCAEQHPGTVYFPSTPCEGAMPFHPGAGLAHYFGVGAYQRGLADLAQASVRFATESLGFSNVPDSLALLRHFDAPAPPTHHPAWKTGVPRDGGSGWDFEDIRDHYLRERFGVDPARLRYADTARYLELSRIVTGELMALAFAFWRSNASGCGGALVWTLADFLPGAGWGLLDSDGDPKPALRILARHLQPVQVLLQDRGLEGHSVSVLNEHAAPLDARLELALWQAQGAPLATASHALQVPARTSVEFSVDALLGGFLDTTGAYRFGPQAHCALSATLRDAGGERLSETLVRTQCAEPSEVRGVTLSARVERADDAYTLCVRSDKLLLYATFELQGFRCADDYLCLLPGAEYRIRLQGAPPSGTVRGQVSALNTRQVFRVTVADAH